MYRYTRRRQPIPPEPRAADDFVRDAPTKLAYGTLVSYAFWLYAYGPALTLLRAELHFSFTLLGVYSAIWSAGAAVAGATFPLLASRLHRSALLWLSALGAGAGAALFALGSGVAVTLLGAAVLGTAGTTLLTVTQAVMSDRHGARRDRALIEANVGAAVCAVLAPLSLGAFAATALGWPAAFALPALALAALWLRYRREPLPRPADSHGAAGSGGLPLACRLFAVLTAAGIAVEFCLVYFGAQVLAGTGLAPTTAATALSSYYLGILAGRIAGAALTRRAGRVVTLLYTSFALTAAGFAAFWLTSSPAVAVIGVLVCGIGIANLYPLSVALALGAAAGREDRANARIQLLGGALVVAAPYALGSLADHVGLRTAFTVEAALIAVSVLFLAAGLQVSRRPAAEVTPQRCPAA